MKKYILLMSLCFIVASQIGAHAFLSEDSTIVKTKLKLDLPALDSNDYKKTFDFDTTFLLAVENKLSELEHTLDQSFPKKTTTIRTTQKTSQNTPARIEKKTFQNISEIEFFHVYGNIVVRESTSKDVELEIHYLNTTRGEGACQATVKNKLLSITTNSTSKNGMREKINYVISIPKNVSLNIDIKYGDVRMNKFNAPFNLNMSYGNLLAQTLSNKAVLKARYSDLKLDKIHDAIISGSYSDMKINKANRIEILGNYNDYFLNDVHTVVSTKSASYGDFKIGKIENFEGRFLYADVIIDNLVSTMNITSTYGDIHIKNVSAKLKSMHIKSSYTDIVMSLDPNLSATIDASLVYGDLNISKKYSVKYSESRETNNSVVKKGQIGSRNPSAIIKVSTTYADIKIK